MDKSYEIGYTTGVFDMFHIGHLNILKRAKARCKYLIVGVSTDALTKEYKKKTPIIPFEDRIEIVKSIVYVDQVIPQTTMDKRKAWEELHFHVLFHGSETYRDVSEAGSRFLPDWSRHSVSSPYRRHILNDFNRCA